MVSLDVDTYRQLRREKRILGIMNAKTARVEKNQRRIMNARQEEIDNSLATASDDVLIQTKNMRRAAVAKHGGTNEILYALWVFCLA